MSINIFQVFIITVVLFLAYLWLLRSLYPISKPIYFAAVLSFIFKIFNAVLQNYIAGGSYAGDSNGYDYLGREHLPIIKDHPFQCIIQFLLNKPFQTGQIVQQLYNSPNTEHLIQQTGLIYYLMGNPSLEGISIIASFLSCIGSYLFLKSYRLRFPEANIRLFGMLIFLYPSVIFWTSLNLKESWVFFYLALATYGASLMFSKFTVKSVLLCLTGIYLGFPTRPHIFLFFISAFSVLVFYLKRGSFAFRLFYKSLLMAIVFYAISLAWAGLKSSYIGDRDVIEYLAIVKLGGSLSASSGIEVKPLESVSDLHNIFYNAMAVLFRPFIFEARNSMGLMSGIEGLFIIWCSIKSVIDRSYKRLRNKFYVFALAYVLLFTVGFSFQVGNLGTMVRMRVLVLPFLFMIFCCHLTKRRKLVKRLEMG